MTPAIAAYSLQLVAAAHADPEVAPVVRKALRPPDDIRIAQSNALQLANRRAFPDDTITPPPSKIGPTTPVPEV